MVKVQPNEPEKKPEIPSDGPLLSVNVKTFPGSESIIDENSEFESKSVEISIPSPTPSQEKMLDNLARQALEVRGREDKQLSNDFQTIEDMLDMIENINNDSKLISEKLELKIGSETEKSKPDTHSQDSISDINDIITNDLNDIDESIKPSASIMTAPPLVSMSDNTVPISVATSTLKSTVMPQLSPLSQPTELTTNMANVSQQIRTFLSSLNAAAITTTSSMDVSDKSIIEVPSSSVPPPLVVSSPISTARIIQQPIKLQTILHTSVSGKISGLSFQE